MKNLCKFVMLGCAFAVGSHVAYSSDTLRLDPDQYTEGSITMPSGEVVSYKAYENLFYVENVEDSVYQTLNIYVPQNLRDGDRTPIFVRTYIGGYMAATAKAPSPTDATGRALKEGYVLCIPGSRGANSKITRNGQDIYTGKAPAGLLDLKAAVRYLRYNDEQIPGDYRRIFIDGTSAGGAMSALVGSTGDCKEYEPYLKAMGAASTSDKVFASICYCPITDLNHADMEYEWLYGCTNTGVRALDAAQIAISDALAEECPAYLDSLHLRDADGNPVTSDNYKNYLKKFLIASASRALQEGCEIPDNIGIQFYSEKPGFGPERGLEGRGAPSFGAPGARPAFHKMTDYVEDIDLDAYLSYVAGVTKLKTPPAFDQWGVLIDVPSPENSVFGDKEGNPANFTDFSLRHRLHNDKVQISADQQMRAYMMNPMNFISDSVTDNVAPHWFIRHGAKDRDTSFLVPINLATRLMNAGYDVDFFLPWNRPHSGDYNLDDLFRWIDSVLSEN